MSKHGVPLGNGRVLLVAEPFPSGIWSTSGEATPADVEMDRLTLETARSTLVQGPSGFLWLWAPNRPGDGQHGAVIRRW